MQSPGCASPCKNVSTSQGWSLEDTDIPKRELGNEEERSYPSL